MYKITCIIGFFLKDRQLIVWFVMTCSDLFIVISLPPPSFVLTCWSPDVYYASSSLLKHKFWPSYGMVTEKKKTNKKQRTEVKFRGMPLGRNQTTKPAKCRRENSRKGVKSTARSSSAGSALLVAARAIDQQQWKNQKLVHPSSELGILCLCLLSPSFLGACGAQGCTAQGIFPSTPSLKSSPPRFPFPVSDSSRSPLNDI